MYGRGGVGSCVWHLNRWLQWKFGVWWGVGSGGGGLSQ